MKFHTQSKSQTDIMMPSCLAKIDVSTVGGVPTILPVFVEGIHFQYLPPIQMMLVDTIRTVRLLLVGEAKERDEMEIMKLSR